MKSIFKPNFINPNRTLHSESEPFFNPVNDAEKSDDIQKSDNAFFSKNPQTPFFNKKSQPNGNSTLQKKSNTPHSPTSKTPTSVKSDNKTGLPDTLKTGVENLSGLSMDDVKVHENSDKPAQVNAHAYAQGTDIHVAPGQEKHLSHEAWHVVQQIQGRVNANVQMKGVNINTDEGLEHEADVMGAKALNIGAETASNKAKTNDNTQAELQNTPQIQRRQTNQKVIQRAKWKDDLKEIVIPDSFLGAKYDLRSITEGYYFLSKENELIGSVVTGMELNDVHIHMVDGKIVVTITQRGGGLGQTTAHFEFSKSGNTVSDYKLSSGKLGGEEKVKALAYATIASFANIAGFTLNTNLPIFSFDLLIEKYGSERAKKVVEAEKERKAQAFSQAADEKRKEEIYQHNVKKLMKEKQKSFLSLQEAQEMRALSRKEFEDEKKGIVKEDKEEAPAKGKRKDISAEKEEIEKPKNDVEEKADEREEDAKKAKSALIISTKDAHKILNQIKKDKNLIDKFKNVANLKDLSSKQLATLLKEMKIPVFYKDLSDAILASEINIDSTHSTDIIFALHNAVHN
jgi:Domain of unknown function (DUF4157)